MMYWVPIMLLDLVTIVLDSVLACPMLSGNFVTAVKKIIGVLLAVRAVTHVNVMLSEVFLTSNYY